MRFRHLFIALLMLTLPAWAQEKPATSPTHALVEDFLKKLNELDGSPDASGALMDLFTPDAVWQTGPNSRQIGPVTYSGRAAIAKAIADLARTQTAVSHSIQYASFNEKNVQLVHEAVAPWGISVAVELRSAWTDRESKRRYMQPGAAFLQIRDGKIWRLRLVYHPGEGGEVLP